jgi:hypothetical protein
MEISGESNLVISRKDISLESELARGRFAVIFLAKYYNKREAINGTQVTHLRPILSCVFVSSLSEKV